MDVISFTALGRFNLAAVIASGILSATGRFSRAAYEKAARQLSDYGLRWADPLDVRT